MSKAREIAVSMEMADNEARKLKGDSMDKPENVNKFHSSKECFRCGKTNHNADKCFYKNSKCPTCKDTGHLHKKCPKGKPKDRSTNSKGQVGNNPADNRKSGKKGKKSSKLHFMGDSESEEENTSVWPIFSIKRKLGTVKGITASIKLKDNAQPKFFKARTVPNALKDQIARELERLEAAGIVEKVDSSDWATPIVPVMKPDGSIRICGDFKITINPVLDVPEYALPTSEELFTKLNGGQKFSKLDLTQAYNQVLLDKESREYVTINTHLGLYRYTRLPFGVASAPAIFQRTIETVLQGLNGVGAILDDVLITGKDDADHQRNLDATLQRLDDYGGPKKGIPVLATSRLQRWAIQLSSYQFDIKYRSTTQNGNADTLSRFPVDTRDYTEVDEEATKVNKLQLSKLPLTAKQIAKATKSDVVLSRVMHFVTSGWPHEKPENKFLPFYRVRDELTVEEGCLLRGIRVIVPERYREEILNELHGNHPGMVRMQSLARLYVWWPNLDTNIETRVAKCESCRKQLPNMPQSRSNPWLWANKPWERVHIDYAGPFLY
ncbi:uncharacterized protein K02A2.6-like [Mizuhopecten yessoensis]|uniref:uncharacterized protein K02A2.6-like n=1 Tax=Mizuhopecten yessoensis TaxID=6573 RepID=UPI000B4583F3|nr:uncharacterized protein K02A2.6-like [Mizuhopecten yessoensis]